MKLFDVVNTYPWKHVYSRGLWVCGYYEYYSCEFDNFYKSPVTEIRGISYDCNICDTIWVRLMNEDQIQKVAPGFLKRGIVCDK